MTAQHVQGQTLPQEIFDNVIDHFHDDTPSLQTCALVAPSWLSSARAHLFHRIALNPPKPTKTNRPRPFSRKKNNSSSCQRLYECIESSANSRLGSLAIYIRELHLCEGMLASEWLATEPSLPELLQSLPNLRRFEISRSASVRIPWGQLSASLKGALEGHVFRLSSFTELKLSSLVFEDLRDLGSVLRACRYLRVLEVDHVMFADESEFGMACLKDEMPTTEKASLDTLVLGPRTSAAFISYLLHPSSGVAVSTVRRLSMSISGNFEDFAKLLHASISLEHLELGLMNDVDLKEYWSLAPEKHFDLSQVPHLQTLKVNIDVLQKLDDPLPWLSTVLRTGINPSRPSKPNQIRSIWIIYSLYLPAPYMDRSANTTIFEEWKEIDGILSGTELGKEDNLGLTQGRRSHAYQNLERVQLDFMLENPIGFGIAPRFLKEVVLDSPGLEGKDVFRMTAADTSK